VTMNRTLERARRRPVVFMLVYGAFLVLIGVTATAQAILTSSHLSTSILSSVATADRAVVGTFIESYVQKTDLSDNAVSDASYTLLEEKLRGALANSDFLDSLLMAVEVVDREGRVLFSSTPDRRGTDVTGDPLLQRALAGRPDADLAVAADGDWTSARM
jgi:hypothetical protein